ncbi:MipA/OmpV family protein [Catenovulum sp. SM1970]|uniref:MipA/OmpV family protein n=1 Tax=Marinifaba aquimaris TaxID=2741323 RepID=UPI0015746664|nr:MipA/OmpV family protein [Marinifaba aquimaris]NTS77019.1 MipA/OmpV family protein [Marinifaba aquimaris]
MSSRLLLIAALLLNLASPLSLANESDCDLEQYLAENCIEPGEFNISVALGYGVKENPYRYEDDIDLYVLPDISFYYGNWFFDKDTFGYSVSNTASQSVNVTLSLSDDSAYFHDYHLANITPARSESVPDENKPSFGTALDDEYLPEHSEELPQTTYRLTDSFDIERKIAGHIGLEWNRYYQTWSYQLAVSQDITGVHQGHGLTLKLNKFWHWDELKVNTNLALKYKSEDWVNYYYGVDDNDTFDPNWHYEAEAGVNIVADLVLVYGLNDALSLLSTFRYEKLDDEISNSPLVDKNHLTQWFSGFIYHF